jgi:hypothetical protein
MPPEANRERRPASHRAPISLAQGHARSAVLRSASMMDIVMLAAGIGLFGATIAYAYACERL